MDSVKLYGVFNDEIIQVWLYPTIDRSNKLHNPFLGEVNSHSFQSMTKQVESAFIRFSKKKMIFLNSNQRRIN